jgi:hypothetical protein
MIARPEFDLRFFRPFSQPLRQSKISVDVGSVAKWRKHNRAREFTHAAAVQLAN